MSQSYQRQEIKSVSSSVLPIALGGIVLAASLTAKAVKSLSSAAIDLYKQNANNASETKTETIKSLSALQSEKKMIKTGKHKLEPVEAIKVSALLSISRSGYVVENSPVLSKKLEDLQAASTRSEAKNAHKALLGELENSHSRIFVKGLTVACKKASIEAGFQVVKTSRSSSGFVRVIASDSAGRALVTEISMNSTMEPEITTETVGLSDGSCKEIMNTFDMALRNQGIKSSAPKRKFTGGVCELKAAKEFVQKKVKKQESHGELSKKNNKRNIRRTQRLNQKTQINRTLRK